ncbi:MULTISPECIES: aspartate 1-decarboxylase [Sinorhizobium]|uniref:Aspartate 1-decarboxylase n=1 Tax=Sinorhizobium americanum TaxID=194963 RepID=A0A2S3YKF3_9HYPH|nr:MULTISPECIES: aspartate 1-decarboxylase [Sinorhizobium]PDT32426.1 aspartate 1-decarboxylase [Sinorhizobium sp. FG01]PDT47685.1 aspartate 1-decarboxylase [Sinorhizobium sp. NG07B]POH28445.1 aspartate 1-decarboxylase [Sinorhizobium americanum]POH28448.1 aspartate 1-decarboxylase [Sinorhizobium americanum]
MRKIVAAKLHGITVTGADLNYHGSITLDPDHCDEAGIFPMEFVEVWNRSSGARISTYVIYGERGSRCCVLNGAAARTCQVGDEMIVCSSTYIEEHQIAVIKPRVLTFDRNNSVRDRMFYDARIRDDGTVTFEVREGSLLAVNHNDKELAVP